MPSDTPPGEREEREALATVLVQRRVGYLWRSASGVVWGAARDDADAILAAGFRRAAAPEEGKRAPPTDQPTGILRDAAALGDSRRLARAVAFELRCAARYHRPVNKTECAISRAFLTKLADNLDWALADSPAPPTAAEAARGKT